MQRELELMKRESRWFAWCCRVLSCNVPVELCLSLESAGRAFFMGLNAEEDSCVQHTAHSTQRWYRPIALLSRGYAQAA